MADEFNKRLDQALKNNDLDLKDGKVIEVRDDETNAESMSGLAFGMRIGVEFAAGTLVGFGLGWAIDSYFETTPWFLMIFSILGFCAGMMNVYRVVNNIDEGIGINRQREKSLEKARNKRQKTGQDHSEPS